MRLLVEHGLAGRGWSFGFNRRKRSLGLCNHAAKRIELSSAFVLLNGVEVVRDTLLHEIAHALAGHKAGHGPRWVAVCRVLGATPRRLCADAEMPRGVFRACCKGCGAEHSRHRRPMRGRVYYCRACGAERGRLRFARAGRRMDLPICSGG